MKRSEMIKILTDSFWKHMNSETVRTDAEMYCNVLRDLENAGMLPPIEQGRSITDLDLGVPEWDKE